MDDFVITGISRAAALVSLEARAPSLGRSGRIGICCVRAFRNHLLGPFELFLLILKFRTDRFT